MAGLNDDLQKLHSARVALRVRDAMRRGCREFVDVLGECGGADPRLVHRVFTELGEVSPLNAEAHASFREISGVLPWHLPAPDPSLAQWWFSLDTLDYLATQVVMLRPGNSLSVVCIGAPTIGLRLHTMGLCVTVLDADRDVLTALKALSRDDVPLVTCEYNAQDELPGDFADAFDVAILDPPWYEPQTWTFLRRAFRAVRPRGDVFLSLPPILTRPEAESQREGLLRGLFGHAAFVRLESAALNYLVPRFEEAALADLPGFSGRPWRSGDLLHVRRLSGLGDVKYDAQPRLTREVYSRRPHEFRVFLSDRATADAGLNIKELEGYSSNVSTRVTGGVLPDIWTSEKAGALIDDLATARLILTQWQSGESLEQTAQRLADTKGMPTGTAQKHVDEYERVLGLWSRYADGSPLRKPEEVERARREHIYVLGTEPTPRTYSDGSDGYRGEYQRDRDRIIWSSGLRRLAHKTQLFPVNSHDELRQRLAHSIEVMQLALTIAASFGLNEDLVQAGALAHDIGHTPFGHAGEHALDRLLVTINGSLPGFNHYEHGVDVVRFLEGPYSTAKSGGFPGLNLTREVAECILKHTYCQSGPGSSSYETVWRGSKHRDVPAGFCHLEGQAVRLADKISYLVSDLEDGIRLGILSEEHLRECRLFYRPPLDLLKTDSAPLHQRFSAQRANLIKVLMQDAILETGRRLGTLSGDKRLAVRGAATYTVDHSPEIAFDVGDVWNRLQAGRLHRDQRVVAANMHAARTVAELTITFALFPDLIEPEFVSEYSRLHDKPYMDFFHARVGPRVQIDRSLTSFLPLDLTIDGRHAGRSQITTIDLIRAKDYVAGLTDARARELHARFVRSNNAAW